MAGSADEDALQEYSDGWVASRATEDKDAPYRFGQRAWVVVICDEVVVDHVHYEDYMEGIKQAVNRVL